MVEQGVESRRMMARMRRFGRILGSTATTGSFLLALALVYLWVRTHAVTIMVARSWSTTIDGRYARTDWLLTSGHGYLSIVRTRVVPVDDASATWLRALDEKEANWGWSRYGLGPYEIGLRGELDALRRIGVDSGQRNLRRVSQHWRSGECPHALAVLVASVPAQVGLFRCYVRRRRRRVRAEQGRCPVCNYDLRASHARCPECGAAQVGIAG